MNPIREHQQCTYCVMDTSDPEIRFDGSGRCNHCSEFEKLRGTVWFPDEEGARRLESLVSQIKTEGAKNEYDSIIGLSGGVDSSYLALKAHEWGLRPLVVHVDGGWNSELAVKNIEQVVNHCGFDLQTHVVNWEDMRDLQLAYLRSGISNQDVPQDHAFFAGLYHFATKNKIKYVMNGGNVATEGIFPSSWHGAAMDARNLRAIHSRYGERKLKDYPVISFSQYYFWYPIVKRMTPVRPLNLFDYSKTVAENELSDIGWRAYPRKHGESLFTRFFQNYYLPNKFGFDKRKPHLSSMIMSGQISRDEALGHLLQPLYDPEDLRHDKAYICRKLRISQNELDVLMTLENRSHLAFSNWERRYRAMKFAQHLVGRLTGRAISAYR